MKLLLAFLVAVVPLQHNGGTNRTDIPRLDRSAKNYWSWLASPWTADDRFLTGQRHAIEALALQGKTTVRALEKIAVDARGKFNSAPKADQRWLTVWLYASWCAQKLDSSSNLRTNMVLAQNDMECLPAIPSYEYARVRFLVNADTSPDKYISLGNRLLARDPNDYVVKRSFVYLTYTRDPDLAKRLCKELLQQYPEKTILLAVMGDVFDVAYMHGMKKDDILNAKKYYEMYLEKSPASDEYRQVVQLRLKRIRKTLGEGSDQTSH